MSWGKIVKKGHKIIPNDPFAPVINKLKNKVVMEAEFDHQTNIWNVYPNKPVSYEFSEKQKVKSLGLEEKQQQQQQQQGGGYAIHLANNAY